MRGNLFTNKHVVVAFLVAPLLALASYFAMDHWLIEPALPPTPGGDYPLLEKSNCRYASGECELSNGNFSLLLRRQHSDAATLTITLESQHALEGVKIAIGVVADELVPVAMQAMNNTQRRWQATFLTTESRTESTTESTTEPTIESTTESTESTPALNNSRIYVVAATELAHYFGEASLAFTNKTTAP